MLVSNRKKTVTPCTFRLKKLRPRWRSSRSRRSKPGRSRIKMVRAIQVPMASVGRNHEQSQFVQAASTYDYGRFAALAGPLTEPPQDKPYRVRYVSLLRKGTHRWWALIRTLAITLGTLCFEVGFFVWLLRPNHLPVPTGDKVVDVAGIVMALAVFVIELFRFLNTTTLCLATLVARDPIPVRPQAGTRVALATTIVPKSEPIEMARITLEAALKVTHPEGTIDVWLLDEGDLPEIKAMCLELGVRHFSRKDIEKWNQPSGRNKKSTKHGNYNAWLEKHGGDYDYLMIVDTDQVPLPTMAERLLGYFRDPDVAFVVGPQVYGNADSNFVTRSAESQQFLFHALVQRAGNAWRSAMLVGTNMAVSLRALESIGGMADSITEDMATSLEFHSRRNPATGRKWRSVYTPDVLAVGEGPSSWTDFNNQQDRWAGGTFDALKRIVWRIAHRLRPGALLHYSLMLSYYPSAALGWILGAVIGICHLGLGAQGLSAPGPVWIMLYTDVAFMQLGLYLWNRRHNVSPHEAEGSSGVSGMVISMLSAPVYVASFVKNTLHFKLPFKLPRFGKGKDRRTSEHGIFAVTSKGANAKQDNWLTFRKNYLWAGFFAALLVVAQVRNHAGNMRLWALVAIVISLTPPAVWLGERVWRRFVRPTTPPVQSAIPQEATS